MSPRKPTSLAAPTQAERSATTHRWVVRCRSDQAAPTSADDEIAVEEPLEVRVAGDPLATLMRTPGQDHFLAVGFLFAEGIITDLADLGRVAHCGRPQDPAFGNVIDVSPGPGVALAPELAQRPGRSTVMSSGCGVCGRETISDLLTRIAPLPEGPTLAHDMIASSLRQLEARQTAFGRTGAMHGALVCNAQGTALACSEDVGRHNAVDKVVGKLLYAGSLKRTEHGGCLLAVSSRSCFEIVQKAAMASLPVVVSVGAPTSLAIDLAQACGLTLVGFARNQGFNIYAHAKRIST